MLDNEDDEVVVEPIPRARNEVEPSEEQRAIWREKLKKRGATEVQIEAGTKDYLGYMAILTFLVGK
jgi:hypothetical protein